MQEIGDKQSKTAVVLCTAERCVKNGVLHIQDVVSAELEAKSHDVLIGHEAVVIYTDCAHPLGHEDAIKIQELTGMPSLDELTTL
jgi:hypothetical protein